MAATQKPLSFSLGPLNTKYILDLVAKQKLVNSRYNRSVYMDDLITHLRTKAEAKTFITTVEVNKPKKPVKRFAPPEVMEVWGYMIERGCAVDTQCTEAHKFCDHFESNGWKVGGKTKMVSWKAAVRNWLKGNGNGQSSRNNASTGQKESSHERIKRENDVKYRGSNECGLGMGETNGDLGRTVDQGQRVETVIGLDNEPFIDY